MAPHLNAGVTLVVTTSKSLSLQTLQHQYTQETGCTKPLVCVFVCSWCFLVVVGQKLFFSA